MAISLLLNTNSVLENIPGTIVSGRQVWDVLCLSSGMTGMAGRPGLVTDSLWLELVQWEHLLHA